MSRRSYADDADGDEVAVSVIQARLAAGIASIHHASVPQTATDEAFLQRIADTYGSEPTDAPMKPGDSRVIIEPLNESEQRRKIPRQDGYDERDGLTVRYGPQWRGEHDRRLQILQSHPHYRFLEMMAGFAGLRDVSRIISVDSMTARAVQTDIRKRMTTIQSDIHKENLDQQRRDLDELKRLERQNLQGKSQLATLEDAVARLERAQRDLDTSETRLSTLQNLRRRYQRLQELFLTWSMVVLAEPNLGRQLIKHQAWLLGVGQISESNLLKDWVSGRDMSAAKNVLAPLQNLVGVLLRFPSSDGGIVLTGTNRTTAGPELVRLLREYADGTYDRPDTMVTTRHDAFTRSLPQFKFDTPQFAQLEAPAEIEGAIAEVTEELRNTKDATRRADLIANRLLLTEELATASADMIIGPVVWARVQQVLTELESYERWKLSNVSVEQFFESFGKELLPTTGSKMIDVLIAGIDAEQAEITRRAAELRTKIELIDAEKQALEQRTQAIRALTAQLTEGERAVARAQDELKNLEVQLYRDAFDYTNRPENSGILDLDTSAMAALSRAHKLAQSHLGYDIELDTLMTAPQWWEKFAMLAGTVLNLAGMTNGKTYTQGIALELKQQEVSTICTQHFSGSSGFAAAASGEAASGGFASVWKMQRERALPRRPGFNPYFVGTDTRVPK